MMTADPSLFVYFGKTFRYYLSLLRNNQRLVDNTRLYRDGPRCRQYHSPTWQNNI